MSSTWGSARDGWPFFDKDTLPLKRLDIANRVRLVPGGSSVRDGAYLGKGVICMPPMYINIGAYVGDGTLVDSHALVGSCAQIGKRVHISAAAQIGGVIEPVGAMPVIIEDDVLVGGNCGVYEGAIIKRRAVLASGTIMTGSTPIYDLPNERIIKPEPGQPLVVPEGAVVVPGARPVTVGAGPRVGPVARHASHRQVPRRKDGRSNRTRAMDPVVPRAHAVDPVSLARTLIDIDSTTGREGDAGAWLARAASPAWLQRGRTAGVGRAIQRLRSPRCRAAGRASPPISTACRRSFRAGRSAGFVFGRGVV